MSRIWLSGLLYLPLFIWPVLNHHAIAAQKTHHARVALTAKIHRDIDGDILRRPI